MYAKYEKILSAPLWLLGLIGLALVVGVWALFGLHWGSLLVLLAFLGLSLANRPLVAWLDRVGVRPNHITVLGCLVSMVAIWPLATGRLETAMIIVLASSLLDALDGRLARLGKAATAFGGFLDSTLDRLSDAAVFIGLAAFFYNGQQLTGVVLSLSALVGAFLVSYARARAETLIDSCAVGVLGERPDRLIIIIIAGLAGRPEIGLVAVNVFAWLTVGRRVVHTWRRLRLTGF